MPHPLSHKYPIPISQLCLVNTDVPAGVGAPPLDTTSNVWNLNLNASNPFRIVQICIRMLKIPFKWFEFGFE